MLAGARDEDDERPVGELFGRLIDDGKAFAKAEVNLVRARAEDQAERAKKPLIFAGLALAFAVAAVIALVMTAVLALATLVGPLAGGLIAVAVALGVAALFAGLARSSWDMPR